MTRVSELSRTTTELRLGSTDSEGGLQCSLASHFSGITKGNMDKSCETWYEMMNPTLRSQVLELALDLVPRLRQVLALQIGSLPFSVSLTLTLGIIGKPQAVWNFWQVLCSF